MTVRTGHTRAWYELVVNKVFAILEADKRRTPANDCYNTTRSTTGQAFWGDRVCVGGFWA